MYVLCMCFCVYAYGERVLSLAAGLDLGAGNWGCIASVGLLDSAATNKGMWV